MKKIIILISLLFTLSGCYDHKELNELAVISGIDINKEKDEYNITIQVINQKNKNDKSEENKSEFVIYKGTGKSLNMAIKDIINKAPQKLYEPQIQVLLVNENICKENIKDVIDFFIRNNEARNEFYVLISKNNKTSILEKIYSKKIINILKSNNNYSGIAPLITLNDLIKTYQNKNIEVTLPIIEKINNNTNEIKITSLGIFKNNKLISYLNEQDATVFNLIMNNINNTIITTNYNNSKYVINELIKPKSKIKFNIRNNKIIINLKATAIIRENNNKIKLEKKDNINKLENDLNKNIEKLIKQSISKTLKKYNSDIYGFKDLIYKNNKKYYKNNIENNKNYLNNINIKINSQISIVNDGNLLGGIDNE